MDDLMSVLIIGFVEYEEKPEEFDSGFVGTEDEDNEDEDEDD